MLEIKSKVSEDIKNQHLDGLRPWVMESIKFYRWFFSEIGNGNSLQSAPSLKVKAPRLLRPFKLSNQNKRITYGEINKVLSGQSSNRIWSSNKLQEFQSRFLRILVLIEGNLKSILISKPQTLIQTNDKIQHYIPDKFLETYKAILKELFPYDEKFAKEDSEFTWKAYDLAENLKVNTCPYCNRNYTFTVKRRNGAPHSRCEFDHFLPKSDYALLQLSLYNLVPSCHTCNHIKGSTPFSLATHIHPYISGLENEIVFKPKYQNLEDEANQNEKFEIKANLDHSLEAHNSFKDLGIDEVYKFHKSTAEEIRWKLQSHPHVEIIQIANKMRIKYDEEFFYSFVVGNEFLEDNFIDKPLSKLCMDIYREFKNKK